VSLSIADLQAFADAWNGHDIEGLMRFMSDDCLFETAAGPDEPSSTHADLHV
jgi:ketosteroid isomerase-like protein